LTSESAFGSSEQEPLPWWLALIEGIALVIVGLLFLTSPGMTTVVVVQILGLYWIFAGILSIVRMFIDSSNWGWKLISGVIGIIAGILILNHPLWSSVILANTTIIILGFAGIIIGIMNIVQAFRGAGWGAGLLGVVIFLLGLALLANNWLFAFSLPWTLGVLSVIGGIAIIFGAFRLRSDAKAAAESVDAPAPPEEEVAEPEAAEMVSSGPGAAGAVEAAEELSEQSEEVAVVTEEVAEFPDTAGEKAKFHQALTYVEGIGPAYAKSLNEAGLMTPMDLLEKGASRKGRLEIAEKTQLSIKLISKWVNQVDMYRVPGIGAQYADLLEQSGVDTIPELAQRNPKNLHKKLVKVNDEKKLVREVAGAHQVEEWVAQAKELPRKITF
jgi:uncharacterized membrane protein HdeD (DUF308 family)/predicted flap endonuclease-1-like 5' DNA nuclease